MKKRLSFAEAVAVLLVAACSGATTPSGPVEITMTATEFQYGPARIEVTAGQPVRLTVQSLGALAHDFSIIEFRMSAVSATPESMAGHDMGGMEKPDLHLLVDPQMIGTLEFTPSQPGTYEFFCTVSGHKEAGMVGQLIVAAT